MHLLHWKHYRHRCPSQNYLQCHQGQYHRFQSSHSGMNRFHLQRRHRRCPRDHHIRLQSHQCRYRLNRHALHIGRNCHRIHRNLNPLSRMGRSATHLRDHQLHPHHCHQHNHRDRYQNRWNHSLDIDPSGHRYHHHRYHHSNHRCRHRNLHSLVVDKHPSTC